MPSLGVSRIGRAQDGNLGFEALRSWYASQTQFEHDDNRPRKRVKIEEDTTSSYSYRSSIPIKRIIIDLVDLDRGSDSSQGFTKKEAVLVNVSISSIYGSQRLYVGHMRTLEGWRFGLSSPNDKSSRLQLVTQPGDYGIDGDLLLLSKLLAKSQQANFAAHIESTLETASTGFRLGFNVFWRDGAPASLHKTSPDLETLEKWCHVPARKPRNFSVPCPPQNFYDIVGPAPIDIVIPQEVKSNLLETELFPFQERAVAWMLQRERLQARHDGTRWRTLEDAEGHSFYVNDLEVTVQRHPAARYVDVRGGLLSEEMGLGKTCEILALLCAHRRPMLDKELDVLQNLAVTGATLIVTPLTIHQQWKDEIQRHAPHLKFVHYEGMSSLAKADKSENDAVELFVEADIVLTTYNVLAHEIHFAVDPPDRSLRATVSKRRRPKSPLVQLDWWRVCLDEAQMVESSVSQAAITASMIPRRISWAVTGTPVKRDVQDLRGLLLFLRQEPFASNQDVWKRMIDQYEDHFKPDFNALFKRIALRHTKDNIREELRLPPQRRIVVTIPFTAVEEQNYLTLFEEMAYACRLSLDGGPLSADWNPDDPSTIEKMREWLVRLRQTCLHPQVGGRNRRAMGRSTAPLRTIAEVLEVMISSNEASVRTEARMTITCLNTKGHIIGNATDIEDRASRAREFYVRSLEKASRMAEESQQALVKEGGQTIHDESDSEPEDDSKPDEQSRKSKRHRLRQQLRVDKELQHACEFFMGSAYFQMKTALGTDEHHVDYQELETKESQSYERAKVLRKDLLKISAGKAGKIMRQVKMHRNRPLAVQISDEFQNMNGGIESRRLLEKLDQLLEVMERQEVLLLRWRDKLSELLLKRLVDVDDEEITGEEYELSTKQQDEMYIYIDAFRAVVADRQTCITGQLNTLVNHEMQFMLKQARLDDIDDDNHERERPESRKLMQELQTERSAIMQKEQGLISLRGLVFEARNTESSIDWQDGKSARAQREVAIVRQIVRDLQAIINSYNKVQTELDEEYDLFKTAMNLRLEFYRQLQQLSDAVKPYKEELDEHLDQDALDSVDRRLGRHEDQLATLSAKQRFLVHLRDESNNQAERICVICQSNFEQGVLTVCGHQFCKDCIGYWWRQHQTCPVCKRKLRSADFHNITYKPQDIQAQIEAAQVDTLDSVNASAKADDAQNANGTSSVPKIYSDMSIADLAAIKSVDLPSTRSFGTKIDTIARHLIHMRRTDPGSKTLIFSQYRDFLSVLSSSLSTFGISHVLISAPDSARRFKQDASIEAFLLDARTDSSGLNLVCATTVILAEPLVNPALEVQAIARVHRIGQTRPTSVFVYLVKDTVEEGVYAVSVQKRLQLMTAAAAAGPSGAATSETAGASGVETAERLQMQSGGLGGLIEKTGQKGRKAGAAAAAGENVKAEDLWRCLFGGKDGKGIPARSRQVIELE